MPANLTLSSPADALSDASVAVFVGRADALRGDAVRSLLPAAVADSWDAMIDSVKPGDAGRSTSTWADGKRYAACVLPTRASRHNCAARPDAVASLVAGALKGTGKAAVVAAVPAEATLATAAAVARTLPRYSRRSKNGEDREVSLAFVGAEPDLGRLSVIADSVRLAGELVDAPTCDLDVDAFVARAEAVAAEVGASIRVLRGEALREGGFGGLWGVGKAATVGPALVVLTHEPAGAEATYAWVGKGIVYDTGGLSIKGKTGMPGMKTDMAGAAAVLGAFSAAVRNNAPHRIHAVLCLAENAVGPDAVRPDDVIALHSGKQVEINNTDAEGRLVLGDGVSFAAKELAPDAIVDMATLTGAQLVATGRRHAGIVCNDDDLEHKAVLAGRSSGDLVHPLPYAPEFFRKEFRSKVADLKNSVKDRMNAQSSCAAQFVGEHLPRDYSKPWLHIDMAGPARSDERGTGFGVALLAELFDFS